MAFAWLIGGVLTAVAVGWIVYLLWTQTAELRARVERLEADRWQHDRQFLDYVDGLLEQVRNNLLCQNVAKLNIRHTSHVLVHVVVCKTSCLHNLKFHKSFVTCPSISSDN